MEKQQPVRKFTEGGIHAAVWENVKNETDTNGTRIWNTITLERVFKDKEGNWQAVQQFRAQDISKIMSVLTQMKEYFER